MIATSKNILIDLERDLKLIGDFKDYTLIDFGAGDGGVLKHLGHLFRETIGVDIIPLDPSIICMNMADYHFKNQPTVLYMYEPLHRMTDTYKAVDTYYRVLTNFDQITYPKFLVAYMDTNWKAINFWCFENGYRRRYSSSSYQIYSK